MNATAAPAETRGSTLGYLPGLDGLRAISVLAVMFFHHYFVFGTERGWMPGGFLGVEVFFVVSGYLITALLLAERRETGRVSLQHFWVRRARRLLPALYVLLAAVTAYVLLFLPDSIATLKGDVIAALTYTSNWWQIIAHRSYAVTSGRPELLKHLWSLAIEEQFYLFWPVALIFSLRKLGRHRTVGAMVAVAAGSTILMAITSLYSVTFAYYATFTRLSGLLLGGVMAFWFAPYRIRGHAAPRARIALNTAGVAGLVVLLWSFYGFTFPKYNTGSGVDRGVFFGGFLIVDLATLLVIAAAVHPASDVGRVLGVKPLQWIGVRSYSLYLWHWPIICITRPRVDFDHFFHLHGWPVFVLRFGASLGAAEVSYRFIETPIRSGALGRYRDRLRDAQGARKRRLVRRGAVVLGSCTLVAILLGTGLAAAQPPADKFGDNANGAVADPGALAALRGEGTTFPNTDPTVAPGTGARPTKTTTRPPAIPRVLAIGDSVMLGAKNALMRTVPGIVVDAVKSRQFGEAVQLVGNYENMHLLPNVLVIGLGTNGRVTPGAIDQIMQLAGKRYVFFLTARVPRLWETEDNDTLHQALSRWPNMRVLEWRDFAGCQDTWFQNDGFHLKAPGQEGYARFVLAGIQGHPLTKCVKQ